MEYLWTFSQIHRLLEQDRILELFNHNLLSLPSQGRQPREIKWLAQGHTAEE